MHILDVSVRMLKHETDDTNIFNFVCKEPKEGIFKKNNKKEKRKIQG